MFLKFFKVLKIIVSVIYLFKNKAYEVIRQWKSPVVPPARDNLLFTFVGRASRFVSPPHIYLYNFDYIYICISHTCCFLDFFTTYRSHIRKHFDHWCLFMNVVVQVVVIIAANLYLFSQLFVLLFRELLCSF